MVKLHGKDVSDIIEYIVYDELEIDETDKIVSPKIEIVSGTLSQTGKYTSAVTFKILNQDKVADNLVYRIVGGNSALMYTEVESGTIISLPESGIYKILAYTYGDLQNKSKSASVVIEIQLSAEYVEEYYLENVDGTYSKDEEATETLEELIGETVESEEKLFTGYTENVENLNRKVDGSVLENGQLVLKRYYDRNEYAVTLDAQDLEIDNVVVGDKNSQTTLVINEKWGKELSIKAVLKDSIGYTFSFDGWESSDDELINDEQLVNLEENIVVPQSDITLVAKGSKEIINYNIDYDLDEGTLGVGVTNPEEYNVESPEIQLNNPSKSGYVFDGWTGTDLESETKNVTIASGSTGNREYKAVFTALEDTPYSVEFFKQEVDGTYTSLAAETENMQGTTDQEVSVIPVQTKYTGFVYDEENENNVLETVINADGTATLRVYYRRIEYTLTIEAGENISSVSLDDSTSDLSNTYKYGETIQFNAIIESGLGYNYEWLEWQSSNITLLSNQTTQNVSEFTMPAGDLTLTAKASKSAIVYTISYMGVDGLVNGNQTTYTVESEDIRLTNLTKDKYKFTGWTGTGLTQNTMEVVIPSGSIGNREYTANWVNYKIIVNHYMVNTDNKVAEEEIFTTTVLGEAYNVADLVLTEEEINAGEVEAGRKYLDSTVFCYNSDTGNTVGTYTETDIEISFYYDVYAAVEIVASPNQDLVGTTYKKLSLALSQIEDVGLNVESSSTEIKVLRNIYDEINIIEDQNVILDLNGKNITSNDTRAIFTVEVAKLQVLDRSVLETEIGAITNEKGNGITVNNNGTLTVGIKNGVATSKFVITGGVFGIEVKQGGIFNYYDGVVKYNGDNTVLIGEYEAIAGEISDYESGYIVNVGIEKTQSTANLAIVSDREVRIGNKAYTYLEDAIKDANGLEEPYKEAQVEIVLLTNINREGRDETLSAAINIDETRNIKLNLDGFTLKTTTANKYTIENSGKLEIVDGSSSGTGKITSDVYKTMLNNNGAELVLNSGTLELNSAGTQNQVKYVVENKGYFEMNGGKVSPIVNISQGIKNVEQGTLKVTGGTIITSGGSLYNNFPCGIYNNSQNLGIQVNDEISTSVYITGGKFYPYNNYSRSTCYGIYNESNVSGTAIVIEGGTFSGNNTKCYGVVNNAVSDINISNAEFKTNYGGYFVLNQNTGTINMDNVTSEWRWGIKNSSTGTIKCNDTIIRVYEAGVTVENGTVEISGETDISSTLYRSIWQTGGVVNIQKCDTQGYPKVVSVGKNIEKTAGQMTIYGGYYSGEVINTSGNLIIEDGEFISSEVSINNTGIITVKGAKISGSTGLLNNLGGTCTLGENDGVVKGEEKLLISKCSNYGVDNYGTFNWYDGVIKGKNVAIVGKVMQIADDTDIVFDAETIESVVYNRGQLNSILDSVEVIAVPEGYEDLLNTKYLNILEAIRSNKRSF